MRQSLASVLIGSIFGSAALFLPGCEPEQSQAQTASGSSSDAQPSDAADASSLDPSATVAAMLDLAEAGDWSTYVGEFYGEQHKFASDADREKLVLRFEQKWGLQVIEGLRQAATVTPTIEDAVGRAVFAKDGQPVFMLYRSTDGRWTFHL